MKKSVILCTYNGEKYIYEQLNSIINQSVKVDEIIISDDCSKDKTLSIIENNFKNIKIDLKIYRNNSNIGFKKNFYRALNLCTGDIIFFSDQDDVWSYDKVEQVLGLFQKNPEALLIFSNAEVTDEKLIFKSYLLDDVRFHKDVMDDSRKQLNALLADNFITGATMAVRKDIIDKAKPFGVEWPHDYWLGVVAAMNKGLYYIDKPLIKYRQHSSNAIGINKKYSMNQIKKMFSKKNENSNRENKYAELRIPLLEHLKKYIYENNKLEYLDIVDGYYNYWKKRISFKSNGIIHNCMIVIKYLLKKEQVKHRNTSYPVLKDFIKAIALAKR